MDETKQPKLAKVQQQVKGVEVAPSARVFSASADIREAIIALVDANDLNDPDPFEMAKLYAEFHAKFSKHD